MIYKFLFVSIIPLIALLNIAAQNFMKIGADKKIINQYTFWGIFCYALSTVIYIYLLSKINLSAAYPITIGLTLIGVVLSSFFYLKETIPFFQVLGIIFISIGILSFIIDGKAS